VNFGVEIMPHVHSISEGPNVGDILDSIESLEAFVRNHGPGRYHVDEIGSDLLPSGHTSRRRGIVIPKPDGTVIVDCDPWLA
jgi:hypothetical protein